LAGGLLIPLTAEGANPAIRIVVPAPTAVLADGAWHRVSIGGRRLAITCKGSGSPTVILEHGLG
jgi:hypothetical protein